MPGQKDDSLPAATDVGDRVRRWRRERGWTQAQLASKASVSADTVSRAESGQSRPQGRTARQLAKALGVELERLLGLDGQPALFPLPDERRVVLVRAILDLDDEEVERLYPALRLAIDSGRRRAPAPTARRRKTRAPK